MYLQEQQEQNGLLSKPTEMETMRRNNTDTKGRIQSPLLGHIVHSSRFTVHSNSNVLLKTRELSTVN